MKEPHRTNILLITTWFFAIISYEMMKMGFLYGIVCTIFTILLITFLRKIIDEIGKNHTHR